MVTRTASNIDNNPYIPLDMEKFAQPRPYSPDEVRSLLEERVALAANVSSSKELNDLSKEEIIRRYKDNILYKMAATELSCFEKDPELYTNLFSLRVDTDTEVHSTETEKNDGRETPRARTKICADPDGNLFLAIDAMKPSDVSFQIHDGKLSFNPAGMSPDQLKEIIGWLDRRGLISFMDLDALKLENTDQKTEEMFAAVKDDIRKNTGQSEDHATTVGMVVDEQTDTPENGTDEENADGASSLPALDIPAPQAKAAPEAYATAMETIQNWMDKNTRRNLSYFVTYQQGYTVFSAFPNESHKNMDEDGLVNEDGCPSYKNDCRIYVKRHPNGNVEISFSTPHGKPLGDAYADAVVKAYKDAGIDRVKFEDLNDANEGSFRTACGREMIVPVGLKLSQTKFDKMIDASEGKNGKNNPKVIKYRRDLAMEFAGQLQAKGINWQDPKNKNNADCRCIRNAIGAYNLAPFRDWWEDFGLRSEYETIVKNSASGSGRANGAAAAIGAAEAVAKLYNAFNEGLDSSGNAALPAEERGTVGFLLSNRCKTLSPEEKEMFREVIAGKENTPIREMSPEDAKKLFGIMQQSEEKSAKNKIEDEYRRLVNDEYYKGNAEWDAVSGFLSDAMTHVNNVAEDIRDTGLPPILISRIGNPKHDFSDIKKEMNRANANRRERNYDDDYDRYRDNRDGDNRDDRRNRSNGGRGYPNGGRRQGYDR